MPVLIILLAALYAPPSQPAPTPAFPKKAGIYAMTSQGPVELKISGEPTRIAMSNVVRCYYAPDAFDRIPVVDAVHSFYVNMMGWSPRDLYIVVGREQLTNPTVKYQRLTGRAVNRGLAFQVISDDLQTAAVEQAVLRLAPSGSVDAATEGYVVLELKNSEGLTDRAYPVRIRTVREP